MVTAIKTQHVKNLSATACKDCIFYLSVQTKISIPNPNWNKCMKYGKIHIATGNFAYEFADFARYDEFKCGASASDFIKNTGQKELSVIIFPIELHINLPFPKNTPIFKEGS